MFRPSVVFVLLGLCLALFPSATAGQKKTPERPKPRKYRLVWADEFDYKGPPDPRKWGFETGFVRNKELQYYTGRPENVRVEDGMLVIEARREKFRNPEFTNRKDKNWRLNRAFARYTSASLTTRGRADWLYGRIEVRARLPRGRGAWPAIWMLGSNEENANRLADGEIDIMEHVGFEPAAIYGTVHTEAYNDSKGTQRVGRTEIENPAGEFHVYAIEWTPEKLDFLVDGRVYYSFPNERRTRAEWPFDRKFYLKINSAVGGEWAGREGIDDASFPQLFAIDYVRVYQSK
ncbi:MAG: glycoside hydrolase family 16 protein [Acidobacteria bacterium]|nr:glycoside hydrolase family 16 protein [Acidobacteriota bacterium]